ncbi:unnamed protein product [Somion occarium]|uniref:Alpha/beta hydrolase fold-3 domain-containing protein n=1 Tax=Somion occarium TaxID=3059160 RepID=A0ABP1E3B2_9APHY
MDSSLQTPSLDPELAVLLSHASPPPTPTSILEQREVTKGYISELQEKLRPSLPAESAYRVEDHFVPVDGGEIVARCLVPTEERNAPNGQFRVLVWFHGGGFCDGSLHIDDFYLRKICVKYNVAVVNVEYRLAPEFPFPTSVNDAYAALKWTAENASLLSASISRGFIVAGVSAGGNLAAAVALRARDDPFFTGRKLSGQILQIPQVIHPDAKPEQYKSQLLSLEINKDAPFLTRDNIDRYIVLERRPIRPRILRPFSK